MKIETDAAKVAANREAIFDLHAKAIAWLEDYTGIKYPFSKFDCVLIPAFQFGGMEHPGAIYYNASSMMLDASATENQRLGRATQALPNGFCGLPVQKSCPHANACLTCPMFLTTAEFLPAHRRQRLEVLQIVSAAEARGQGRLVEMNQTVADNLTRIITVLEDDADETRRDAA